MWYYVLATLFSQAHMVRGCVFLLRQKCTALFSIALCDMCLKIVWQQFGVVAFSGARLRLRTFLLLRRHIAPRKIQRPKDGLHEKAMYEHSAGVLYGMDVISRIHACGNVRREPHSDNRGSGRNIPRNVGGIDGSGGVVRRRRRHDARRVDARIGKPVRTDAQ